MTTDTTSIAARVAALDWSALARDLDARGWAETPPLLSAAECDRLAALFDDDARFRARVDMARHRFGEGRYKYFAEPLPAEVAALRQALYPPLAAVANRWAALLGGEADFPDTLDAFRARCAAAGQTRPTPLLLRYEAGGYNCLHQDLYGAVAFPFQAMAMLREPERDFTGGEFLLVEQRPRAQSAGTALRPARGAIVLFTTRTRPVAGARGHYRVQMRHGVSPVRSGRRETLGVIFHDAA
ncbi:Protein of unknown function DUF2086 [Gemmatirosa kalamazoonensis]|uniref:Fe2OG dioxygenase domain-containing protein n=1 Tax=Gemmatirosa kalamazoonensis TaxID=861299 RepID=W0RFG8_9BACT|nr:2OG-Fe(II) oxygenase [Gemmatirosa kalamazoonensis]AHG89085.1 Protein of unknown function DUF2086 [Gemmatirosa kalamazoonensis]